jgi:hypothetical protein
VEDLEGVKTVRKKVTPSGMLSGKRGGFDMVSQLEGGDPCFGECWAED